MVGNKLRSVLGGADLEQRVPEGGGQVRVRDLLHAEHVHVLQVLPRLDGLEFGDHDLSVVDCEELDQFLIVLDILGSNFDRRLQVQDIVLFAGLGLEEGLESGFASRQLLHLSGVASALLVASVLSLGDLVSALDGVGDSLDIQ